MKLKFRSIIQCSLAILSFLHCCSVRSETRFAFEMNGERRTVGDWLVIESKDAVTDTTSATALLGGKTIYQSYDDRTGQEGLQSSIQFICEESAVSVYALLSLADMRKFEIGKFAYLVIRKDDEEPISKKINVEAQNLQDKMLVIGLWRLKKPTTPDELNGSRIIVRVSNPNLESVTGIFNLGKAQEVMLEVAKHCK
jgi:hypothetical protein